MLKNKSPLIKDRVLLGRSGIKVSPLCFGTLTIGPLQAYLPLKKGVSLLRYALEKGINFFDTAELYGTYPYIKEALRGWNKPVVIASKSYDYTREGMKKSLNNALEGMGIEKIDIFLLHEQESILTLKGHMEAFEYLLEAKETGLINAVGISTHCPQAVEAALEMELTDIIHPLINLRGIGIKNGTLEDMLSAVMRAHHKGIGIYAMKPLGGGHLIPYASEALEYIQKVTGVASTAIGMQSKEEVDLNCWYFSGEKPPKEYLDDISLRKRRLMVHDWCEGCGKCLDSCTSGALRINKGKVEVNNNKCILCGYCGSKCPEFCLKII